MLVVLDINIKEYKFSPSRDRIKDAAALQNFLMLSSEKTKLQDLPKYKFYSKIVEILYNCRSTFGGEIEASLFELRKNIAIDVKETRKIRDLFFGGLFQNIFLNLYVAFFYVYSRIIIEVDIDKWEISLVFLWSLVGGLTYIIIFKILERKTFSLFSSYLTAFYKFKILLSISRPINEILESSKINELKQNKKIGHLKERIENLVIKIKNSGCFSVTEIDFILKEIWDFFEHELLRFNKFITVFKLVSILIFVLPCFLYSTFTLIQHLNL